MDLAAAVTVVADRVTLGLVDGPPDNPQQSADRNLQQQHQPDEGPSHAMSNVTTARLLCKATLVKLV
jgi:hypothetical protein